MKDRVIALAGLMQALYQVQGMANNGHFETQPLSVCMDSLFRFDAETPEEIFGSQSAGLITGSVPVRFSGGTN